MQYLLAALTVIGVLLSLFLGPVGLVLAIPAGAALLWLLTRRQPQTPVDDRYLGGAQPDMGRAAQVEKRAGDNAT